LTPSIAAFVAGLYATLDGVERIALNTDKFERKVV
jgi:hypothetical protein